MTKISACKKMREGFSILESTVCLFVVSAVFISMIEICSDIAGATKKSVEKLEEFMDRENARNVQKESFYND